MSGSQPERYQGVWATVSHFLDAKEISGSVLAPICPQILAPGQPPTKEPRVPVVQPLVAESAGTAASAASQPLSLPGLSQWLSSRESPGPTGCHNLSGALAPSAGRCQDDSPIAPRLQVSTQTSAPSSLAFRSSEEPSKPQRLLATFSAALFWES